MPDAILEIKRRISRALLDMPGISGVGVRGSHVVVYLETDDVTIRRRVEAVAHETVPNVELRFEATGPLRKQ